MYYLKTKEFKYLVISYGRDDGDPNYFTAFKHKGKKFFQKWSIVIDFCIKGRRFIIEF